MPCILKQKTSRSPGIITFTQNEALYGFMTKSSRVRKYLEENSKNRKWIYGVHIQGDCSYLKEWPFEPWHNFIMWPDTEAPFLSNIPKEKLMNMNCINFLPNIEPPKTAEKKWDICVVSRPSKIKRIAETLYTVKQLMSIRPETKTVFIVLDSRDISKGEKTYEKDGVDRRYFDLPLRLFTSEELKKISFLSSSMKSFGMFPVSHDLVTDIMAKSKFLLLTSHREGTPRVIVESLMSGTPCIVSKNLRCGILDCLNDKNTLYLNDDIDLDADAIAKALDNYSDFSIDRQAIEKFKAEKNTHLLKKHLTSIITSLNCPTEGDWYLEDLHLRLAGHGLKHNFQFTEDENSLFHWLDYVQEKNPYDEDGSWREEKLKINGSYVLLRIKNIMKKIIDNGKRLAKYGLRQKYQEKLCKKFTNKNVPKN